MSEKVVSIEVAPNKRLPEELKEIERKALLEQFKKILNLETLEHNEVEVMTGRDIHDWYTNQVKK